MKFYLEPTEKVFSAVESSEKGLTSAEAEQRLAKYGKNKLKEAEKDSLFKKFITSLAVPMIIMLLVAAAIQAVVTVVESGANFSFRDFADVLVILVVVIINTVMSLVQDSKAAAAPPVFVDPYTGRIANSSESTGGETEENDPPAEVTSGSLTVIGEATGNE